MAEAQILEQLAALGINASKWDHEPVMTCEAQVCSGWDVLEASTHRCVSVVAIASMPSVPRELQLTYAVALQPTQD